MLAIKRIVSFSLFTLFVGYMPLALPHEEDAPNQSPWNPIQNLQRNLSEEQYPLLQEQNGQAEITLPLPDFQIIF